MAVETLPYLDAVKRMIRAAGRRVAEADEFELYELTTLRAEVEAAIVSAIDGQMNGPSDRSWADIASALGTTRQAAFKRYAAKVPNREVHEGVPADVIREDIPGLNVVEVVR